MFEQCSGNAPCPDGIPSRISDLRLVREGRDIDFIWTNHKWYNTDILKGKLPDHYDLILVDGPPGFIGRHGFYTHLDLFKTDLTIIFDDVHRKAEYELMVHVGQKLQRNVVILTWTYD